MTELKPDKQKELLRAIKNNNYMIILDWSKKGLVRARILAENRRVDK